MFVVGEERGSDGAKAANALASGSRFLVNGEPTDNRMGTATRGVYRAKLKATGKAAHSSLPELCVSAIYKLIDALVALRDVRWPEDPVLGRSFYSIGLINGGGKPTEALRSLVAAHGTENWSAQLKRIVETGYPEIIKLPLDAIHISNLKDAFTEKYKIQVDYLAGQEGQHYARIEPEFAAGKLTVDLYLGGPNVPILRINS